MTAAEEPEPVPPHRDSGLLGWLTLRETRGSVRGMTQWLLAIGIALAVGTLALWLGGMLTIFPTQGTYTVEIIWYGSIAWWFYPELLIVQPWGIVQLPWFPTLAMLAVAAGAGLGSAASLGLLRRYLAARRRRAAGTAGGVAAGAGPGVVSLATHGACCCTRCTTTGSLANVAVDSATSTAGLLDLEWFMPVFQLVIVYVALMAQERAIRLSRTGGWVPPPPGIRLAAGTALRLGLLIAGITWSLAMFVEWGTSDLLAASAATWYHWLLEHQLLSVLAIAAALFPQELATFAVRSGRRITREALRGLVALAAISWGIGVPAPLSAWGLGGLANELAVGVGAGGPSAALLFHWVFQHALLSAFALAFALRPELAVRPLRWSTAQPVAAMASTGRGDAPEIRTPMRQGRFAAYRPTEAGDGYEPEPAGTASGDGIAGMTVGRSG